MTDSYTIYRDWCVATGRVPPTREWWDWACALPRRPDTRTPDQREIDRERDSGWCYQDK